MTQVSAVLAAKTGTGRRVPRECLWPTGEMNVLINSRRGSMVTELMTTWEDCITEDGRASTPRGPIGPIGRVKLGRTASALLLRFGTRLDSAYTPSGRGGRAFSAAGGSRANQSGKVHRCAGEMRKGCGSDAEEMHAHDPVLGTSTPASGWLPTWIERTRTEAEYICSGRGGTRLLIGTRRGMPSPALPALDPESARRNRGSGSSANLNKRRPPRRALGSAPAETPDQDRKWICALR